MKKAREDLRAIYTAAITAVNPEMAVENHVKLNRDTLILLSEGSHVREFQLERYKNIYVVGSGKATAPMAGAIEKILADKISRGLITVKYGYLEDLSKIEIVEASHPIPDMNGVAGARRIMDIIQEAEEDDLVISLISGGGSALLPLPYNTISLEEKGKTTDLLLKSGATIHELNSVRKHLSQVKGGNLARAAYPATVINLMISDVVGDDMDVIASGPFVPDKSTFSGAMEILKRYDLINKIPESVRKHIQDGIDGAIEETPKEGSDIFKKVTNLIIASNIIALKAAQKEAEKRGYNSIILSSLFEGETRDVAYFHAAIAKEVLASSHPVERPACIISGGETTVTVRGEGLGGRNMEFAMHAAVFIDGYDNILMASIGTDGTDGPTDAAGATADGKTVRNADERDLDITEYIRNNDSYHFFQGINDLIITGPTNTNVMDIRIIIVPQ
jgi:glycerate 2-kinase